MQTEYLSLSSVTGITLVAPAKSISLKRLRCLLLSLSEVSDPLSAERNSFWSDLLQLLQFSMMMSAKSDATKAWKEDIQSYYLP